MKEVESRSNCPITLDLFDAKKRIAEVPNTASLLSFGMSITDFELFGAIS